MNKALENKDKKHAIVGDQLLDDFAPYLMNRIMGRYNESLRQKMTSLDLTTPKMRALAVLSALDGIFINELAVYAVVEQSTLSRALDQLSADGLVKREIDSIDTRATRIYMTKTGSEAFKSLWPDMLSTYNEMFKEINEDEKSQFIVTLRKILKNIRKHDF
ncbi:MAG: MarR family transcriptional regulator [Rhodobacteraceae bacterium]|jgi:DNA-binding MarR family transcriptional regulator|nr:MarR family transcriptional regulator [Paracoccaceae bacterium]MDC0162306.1 MarR family transcriptional regulator [Paracoccaceae bacterium]RZO34648.1 MAG: MarR family transcriptional regulator [Paracoccaceae bacterium]|tara:strand:+ start:864 stop:1346 length:483 start_codon:yes stop_codon:yes gene_type:complete